MPTYADIELALKTKLQADATLPGLASNGIFHLKAPHDTQPPFMLYRVTEDTEGERPFAADTLMVCAVETIAVTSAGEGDADDARTMSDRGRTVLNRVNIASGALTKCEFGARGYGLLDFDQNLITCSLTYDVRAQ